MTIEIKNQLDLSGIEGLSEETQKLISERYTETVTKEVTPLKGKVDELLRVQREAKDKADQEARSAEEARKKAKLDKAASDKDVESLMSEIERLKGVETELNGVIDDGKKKSKINEVKALFLEKVVDDRAAKNLMTQELVGHLDYRDGNLVVVDGKGALTGQSVNELMQSILTDPLNEAYVRADVGSGGEANGSATGGKAAGQKTMPYQQWAKLDPKEAKRVVEEDGVRVI